MANPPLTSAARPLPAPSPMAARWTLDPGCVFLNHGSFGACPTPVLARQREWQDLIAREPIRFFVEMRDGLLDEAHRDVGRVVNADPAGLVHTPNATAGVNTVLRSLRFERGDELLTNSHEYNACNNVLRWAAEQWGAKVVTVDAPFPVREEGGLVEAVLAGVTPRTKLVLLSHVTSPTGLIFPVAPIVAELNRRGIDSLVDGAHVPGQIALDIAAINPTYYTGNFHKWLCAPPGSAFLWVRGDRRAAIRPLIISHGANSTRTDRSRLRLEFDYTGTFDYTPYLCVPEAERFLSGLVPGGLAGLMKRNHDLVLRGRDVLCRALSVEPPVPDRMLGSMAAVPLPKPRGGVIPSALGYHDALQDRLIRDHGVQVPVFPFPPGPTGAPGAQRLIRISMQAYNSIQQVEYLAECLREELARESAGT